MTSYELRASNSSHIYLIVAYVNCNMFKQRLATLHYTKNTTQQTRKALAWAWHHQVQIIYVHVVYVYMATWALMLNVAQVYIVTCATFFQQVLYATCIGLKHFWWVTKFSKCIGTHLVPGMRGSRLCLCQPQSDTCSGAAWPVSCRINGNSWLNGCLDITCSK